jgi:hypothetical protein
MYTFRLDGTVLPIPPSEFTVKIQNQNKTHTLIDETEINVLKKPGLTDISFMALLPQTHYPFASYEGGFKDADYFLERFEKLKAEKRPFWLTVSRALPGGKQLFGTEMRVSLEKYEIREQAEEGFDLSVSLELKQYRDFGTKTITITPPATAGALPTASATSERPPGGQPAAKTYIVQPGDSLYNIAKKTLGTGERYTEIYALNRDKIQNANAIAPGQVLTLP